MSDLAPFAEAAVRTATPLLLAAIGETISERAGVINIALEGCIIAGAYAAYVGAAHPAVGYSMAVGSGVVVGAALVLFSILLRRDQIIVGTALTLLALGISGSLFRASGAAATLIPTTQQVAPIPALSALPVVGRAFFSQAPITYLAFLLVLIAWFVLERTQLGLSVRAIGDAPDAAAAAGIRVRLIQASAVLVGAALGGLAGGALVLAQAGTFAEGMSAGRGFLAIAIVALGRWRIGSVAAASFLFGAAMALQFVVQALGWRVRYELVLMIPYVLTLLALGVFGRGVAPRMLGRAV